MDIVFKDRELKDLAEFGKCKKGKYAKLPNDIVKRFLKVLMALRACSRKEDLFRYPSLRYEKLKGTDFDSLRVNDQWRVIIKIEENGFIIECIEIHELSKHYE